MDAGQALREMRTRQEQTIGAAYAPLPWWNVGGRFLIFSVLGALGEADPSGMNLGFPIIVLVSWIAFEVLRVLTERRAGVRLHAFRRPRRVVASDVGETVVVLTVLVLSAVPLNEAGVPLPAALAGVLTGAAAAAIAQPVQRLRSGTPRRR